MMATIDDLITRIGRRLRRKITSGTNLHTEVLDELTNAQNQLEEGATVPWFLNTTEVVAKGANASTIDMQADLTSTFIRLQDDEPVKYVDPTGAAVEDIFLPAQSEILILLQRYPGTGDVPKEWALDGQNIVVRPKPTQGISYNIRYVRKDPTLPAAGATTLWSLHYAALLMNMAGREIAWTLRDNDATQRFETDLGIARTEFIRSLLARENAGQVHEMGDP